MSLSTRIFYGLLWICLLACKPDKSNQKKTELINLTTDAESESTIEGMPTQTLAVMIQDKTGLLWLGARDGGGVFTFDGYNSNAYKPDPLNPNSFQGRYIKHLFEDSKGNIWIGTADSGLHLYDPKTGKFSQYLHQKENPKTVPQNHIVGIWEDAQGQIWTASETEGISKVIDTKTQTNTGKDSLIFENYKIKNTFNAGGSSYIFAHQVSPSNKNIVWIGTDQGIIRFDTQDPGIPYQDAKVKPYNILMPKIKTDVEGEGNVVFKLKIVDFEDRMVFWLGTKIGLKKLTLSKRKDEKQLALEFLGNPIINGKEQKVNFESIHQNQKKYRHIIWIACDKGVFYVDDKENKIHGFPTTYASLQNINSAFSFFEDKSGLLFISTNNGLRTIDFAEKKFNILLSDQILSKQVDRILIDKAKNIWLGSQVDSLNFLTPQKDGTFKVQHLMIDKDKENLINKLTGLCQDTSGNLWGGTSGKGVFRFHPKDLNPNSRLINYKTSPTYKRSYSGKVKNAISHDYISSMYCDLNGNVWIATWGQGLNRYNPLKDEFIHYKEVKGLKNSLMEYNIMNMMQDNEGQLWLGTRGAGLLRFKPTSLEKSGTETFTLYTAEVGKENTLIDNNINTLFQDKKQRIWIGTSGGLSIYDTKQKKFNSFNVKNGLPIESINQIREDKSGNIWLIRGNIFVKTKPEILFQGTNLQNAFQKFEVKNNVDDFDKLFESQTYIGNTKDKLYILAAGGLVYFDPSEIQSDSYLPNILLTDLKINHKSVPIGLPVDGSVILRTALSLTKQLNLSHLHQTISFQFAGLHYKDPLQNQYMYKMEGFDKDWIYTNSKKRFASYTNLPAGDYIFKIRTSNHDGLWNKEDFALKIKVHPAWWNTWWFRTLIFSAILLTVILVFRWRLNAVKQQKIRLEKLVALRTSELVEKNNEIASQNEELHQQAEELLQINEVLNAKQNEIATQNEELFQQSEELKAQRDAASEMNKHLELANSKIMASEQVLIKSNDNLKKSQIEIQEQKEKLEAKNRQVRQSINAALTIQQAILPQEAKMNYLLKNYFIFYKPKDVVSGDFYWINEVNGKITLFVADCTGHGVPGAFMTLIGNILLDKIVCVWNITDPAQILTRLHEEINIILKQKQTNNNSGMDAIVLNIEYLSDDSAKIEFAGAKNSLYYFNPDSNQEVMTLKGTRRAIGGEQNEMISFENHTLILPKNTILYSGSDGFADQNNIRRKKFGEERLIRLIQESVHLSLSKQEKVFEQNLFEFMGDALQRDDILWMGFKI